MDKKRRLGIVMAGLSLLIAAAPAPRGRILCEGFLPPNNRKIPVGDVRALGIDQNAFNRVIDDIVAVYAPIVKARGGTLKVNRRWEDPTVNASAEQWGSTWVVNMYGGLARHAAVTEAGFALVVCHELGHHLGGFPRYAGLPWASNEGQSDYFAVAKCLRKTFPAVVAGADPVAAKRCAAAFPKGPDRDACLIGTLGGMSVARLFQDLDEAPAPARFDTPDPSQVSVTSDDHPQTQCRLDTYLQGSLCVKSRNEDFSSTEGITGACTAAQGFVEGFRPRCWYKPAAGEAAPALPNAESLVKQLDEMRAALSGGSL